MTDTPTHVKPGLWRNRLGAELEVQRPYGTARGGDEHSALHDSGIWLALAHDRLLGTQRWLVTAQGLAAAGYEPVEVPDAR